MNTDHLIGMVRIGLFAAVCAGVVMVAPAAAADGLIRFGFENGGDDIATLEFDDGDRARLEAGGEVFIEAGARLGRTEWPLETDITLGYKRGSISASNADVTLERITLQAIAFYRLKRWRVGGGLTWHREPELDFDTAFLDTRVTADNAVGVILAVDYGFNGPFQLGLRFTDIDYETDNGTSDAGSVGIYATVVF